MRTAARTPVLLALTAGLCAACREAPPPPGAPEPPPAAGMAAPTVYFQELKAFLPAAVDGYRPVEERGSTGRYGAVSVSEAERVFREDSEEAPREIAVRIVDTTLNGRLGESIRAAVRDAAARPPSDPTAPIQLRDALGFVRYDPDEEQAEANLLVGGRYVVAVTTRGFQSTQEARRIARTLNLEGLAQLR